MSARDACLDYLLTHRVQPALDSGLTAISGFPASQAMQARLHAEQSDTAERFEFFLDGVEIANGSAELTDPKELEGRMLADGAKRRALDLPPVKPDPRLLAAMNSGLPACAGVAVGIDRLLMRLLDADSIQDVVAFPTDRA